MEIKKNVGSVDQMVRALLILDLLVPCLLGLIPTVLASFMVGVAVMLLLGCLTGYCWLYSVFAISTRHKAIP